MEDRAWRVLVIDDNSQMASHAARELTDAFAEDSQISLEVMVETDFSEGFQRVRRRECDIAVLDVRRDRTPTTEEVNDRGRQIYDEILKVRFLPVIFWTALPSQVIDLKMPPLVDVFNKDQLALVPDAIRSAVDSGTVGAMRDIEDHVEGVIRDYMWNELAPNWKEYTEDGTPQELGHVLITRIAQSLQDLALPELTREPSNCYLYPPVSERYRPGDLLLFNSAEGPQWWVVLTPACDLVHDGKADYAFLGRAFLLSGSKQYKEWSESRSNKKWNALSELLAGKRERFYYLPEYRTIPDLILDLEAVKAVRMADLAAYERVASLVAPYSDALLARNSRFRGRIGTPDLNADIVKERLSRAFQNP